MDDSVQRYIKRKSRALAHAFPYLEVEDLEHEAWLVWAKAGRTTNKHALKKFFNATWMAAVRESQRFTTLDTDLPDECSLDAYKLIDCRHDLKAELLEVETPSSEWRLRVAKDTIRRYLHEN